MRPYGYEHDRLTARPDEGRWIEIAAKALLEHGSLRSAARLLNEGGSRTSSGGLWQPVTLRRVLGNPKIAGLRENTQGRLVKCDAQPLIDRATYQAVNKVLSDPSRKAWDTSRSERVYLLTGGLAGCGLCGNDLVSRPDNSGKRGYVCRTGPPTEGCGRIRVAADPLEAFTGERILAHLLSPKNVAAMAPFMDRQIAEVEAKALEAQLAGLGEDYGTGVIGRTEFIAARNALTRRLDAAREAMAQADRLTRLPDLHDQPALLTWWNDESSLADRRLLAEAVIERVTVNPAGTRGSRHFDPERVLIAWKH